MLLYIIIYIWGPRCGGEGRAAPPCATPAPSTGSSTPRIDLCSCARWEQKSVHTLCVYWIYIGKELWKGRYVVSLVGSIKWKNKTSFTSLLQGENHLRIRTHTCGFRIPYRISIYAAADLLFICNTLWLTPLILIVETNCASLFVGLSLFLIRSDPESYYTIESIFRITFKISLLYALQTWTHFHKFLEEIIFVVDNLKLFLFQNTLQSRTKKSPGNIFFQI